jgi:alpha-L-fucosidase 2
MKVQLHKLIAAVCLVISTSTYGQDTKLDDYDVTYNTPGPGSQASMPLGNGDIGLNAWVETDGTLSFYISKTDAWGGRSKADWDPWMKRGGALLKLGAVHIRCEGVDAGSVFSQKLILSQGAIYVHEGSGSDTANLKIWVDANQPVVRVEVSTSKPVKISASVEDWRLGDEDRLLSRPGSITWYHQNPGVADTTLTDPHLADITFGATMKGSGMEQLDSLTLQSKLTTHQLISIYALTEKGTAWSREMKTLVSKVDQHPLGTAWMAHHQWWMDFWSRSWINVYGSKEAEEVTRGYILQRFKTACAGRGAYPIKFNGSIFVVDNPDWQGKSHTADFRAWGGMYWFQNTRPMYWARLMAGDYDLMMPLFRMYKNILPVNAAQVKQYYGHGGTYFQETTPWWGGIPFMGPEVKALYTNHYFTPILELSMMMLDYVDYTQDTSFARQYLIPIASAGLTFFAEHFGRDSAGKLLLDPDNAIETFWKVHDPAPDIAALHAVIPRMLSLAPTLTTSTQRSAWKDLLAELPDLPQGDGKLLPYTGPQTAQLRNVENPELYAIYPYRLYGIGKPDLDLAKRTFAARRFTEKGCWVQDPIQAAFLGLDSIARTYVHFNFTRKDPSLRFPAFWAVGHDYLPDEDNGGNGEYALQHMLLQADGNNIWLLPAWPKDWNADFKLHAPLNTTIEGRVEGGKITRLVVTPSARANDVKIIM